MNKNIKYVAFSIVIAVALGIAYGIAPGLSNMPIMQGKDLYVSSDPGFEKYKTAGEPFLTASANVGTIDVKRGTTSSVMLILKHEAGANPDAKFVVTPKIDGYFFPSSVVKSTTMLQRSQMLANSQIPLGARVMKDFVTFSPQSVSLASGESKEIQMQISLPSDLPDEIIGHKITISPLYDISDKEGIDNMGVFTTSITVNVES